MYRANGHATGTVQTLQRPAAFVFTPLLRDPMPGLVVVRTIFENRVA